MPKIGGEEALSHLLNETNRDGGRIYKLYSGFREKKG
jgi:hypothetical protein